MGVQDLPRQGDAKGLGVDRNLGDKPVVPFLCLYRCSPQGAAVPYLLVQVVWSASNQVDHPGLERLAEPLQVGLIQQVVERGIRGPAPDILPHCSRADFGQLERREPPTETKVASPPTSPRTDFAAALRMTLRPGVSTRSRWPPLSIVALLPGLLPGLLQC